MWVWVLGVLAVWSVLGAGLALLIGRGIRIADLRSPGTGVTPSTADLPASSAAAAARVRRRAVPLPPIGISLAAIAVALETTGYVLRLDGATGPTAQVLSMDAPLSLPRMFVAFLFTAGALAAVAGAATLPGRRSWWLAVAVVSGGIASVKAGGTVHSRAMGALSRVVGSLGAQAVSVVLAVAVLTALWFFSRTERRDRRRVLGTLGGYAVASVGLSAISAAVSASWSVTATFVEESGEALAGVAFFVAVLVGVAPQLVLPATWPLRRSADARTADAGAVLPVRTSPPEVTS